MSVFHERSELSSVNRSAGVEEAPVNPEMLEVLNAARHYHGLSGGIFDVTIEPFCLGTEGTNRLLRSEAETEFILVEGERGSLRETHLKGEDNG